MSTVGLDSGVDLGGSLCLSVVALADGAGAVGVWNPDRMACLEGQPSVAVCGEAVQDVVEVHEGLP
ncbi:hypothetical protein [Micromonospora viridifaciens]|uniref:hypothetical protein n=1 Tax=Micromonospora viridifaciens TaxID=1881 RepID=UPI001E539E95|nr:hypothetical protein [Micromonospora viridifaciens]